MDRKKKVAYFYDPDVGGFYYGPGHPMKPHRVRMAHALLLRYGLHNMMDCYRPRPAAVEDMRAFHSKEYVSFLENAAPDALGQMRGAWPPPRSEEEVAEERSRRRERRRERRRRKGKEQEEKEKNAAAAANGGVNGATTTTAEATTTTTTTTTKTTSSPAPAPSTSYHPSDSETDSDSSEDDSLPKTLKGARARYAPGEDCPLFPGLFRYCQLYSGGSVGGAVKLNHGGCDVAINWAGGLHHAKKSEASGFCYVNDIVLAILEMLKYHARVLYIDIDVHHGDGVEEAFLTTDRVLTVSFHKYGNGFFPGTGSLHNVGVGQGKGFSLNAPLRDGIDDEGYESVFAPVMDAAVAKFDPGAIVLQCGADSLAGDRLGRFNLTSSGHAAAVSRVAGYGRPLLVLGGGGYKVANVARCWASETGELLGAELDDEVPAHEYTEFYAAGGNKLRVPPRTDLDNANSKEYLSNLRESLLRHVQAMPGAPNSGQTLGGERPADAPVAADDLMRDGDDEDDDDDDGEEERGGGGKRNKQPLWDGTRDEIEDRE